MFQVQAQGLGAARRPLSTDIKLLAMSFLDGLDALSLLSTDRSWNELRKDERCCRLLYRLFFGAFSPQVAQLFEFAADSSWETRFNIRVQTRLNMVNWQPTKIVENKSDSVLEVAKTFQFLPFILATHGDGQISLSNAEHTTVPVCGCSEWAMDKCRQLVITWCRTSGMVYVHTFDGKLVSSFDKDNIQSGSLKFDNGEMFLCSANGLSVFSYLDAKQPCTRYFSHPKDHASHIKLAVMTKYIILTYGDHQCFGQKTVLLRRTDLEILDQLRITVSVTVDSGETCIVQSALPATRRWIVGRNRFMEMPARVSGTPVQLRRMCRLNARFVDHGRMVSDFLWVPPLSPNSSKQTNGTKRRRLTPPSK